MPVIPVLGRRQAEGREHKFTSALGYPGRLSRVDRKRSSVLSVWKGDVLLAALALTH